MKQVQYECDGSLEGTEPGDVIVAYLVAEDPDTRFGLIFHPIRSEGGSGCFEFAKRNERGYWSIVTNCHYVNIP